MLKQWVKTENIRSGGRICYERPQLGTEPACIKQFTEIQLVAAGTWYEDVLL
jgi:hypothetical protein